MKSLLFLSIAFLSGAHGFVLFAVYAAIVATAAMVLRSRFGKMPAPAMASAS